MSFQKIVTYSTALIFTCAASLFIDAQTNQASALSDRCLTSVYEVTMALNKITPNSDASNYPVFFPSHEYVPDTWVNAPSGKIMTFGSASGLPEKYRKKVSTEIINNCKGTVAVQFTTCLEYGCQDIYGIVKGKVIEFKGAGCKGDDPSKKLKWGYVHSDCM
jgi:hypothetical protein